MTNLGYTAKQGWVPYDTGTASNVITTSTIQQYVEQYTPVDDHDHVFETTLNHGCVIGGTSGDQENGIQVLRHDINDVNNITSTGQIQTASLTATGNIQGDTLTAIDNVQCASLTATGHIQGASLQAVAINCSSLNEISNEGITCEGSFLKDGAITTNSITTPQINGTSNNLVIKANTVQIKDDVDDTYVQLDKTTNTLTMGKIDTASSVIGTYGMTVSGGGNVNKDGVKTGNLNLTGQTNLSSSPGSYGGSVYIRGGHSQLADLGDNIIMRASTNAKQIVTFQNSASTDIIKIGDSIALDNAETQVLTFDPATKKIKYRNNIPASISSITVTKATEILVFNAGVLTGTNTNVYFNLRSIYDSTADVRIVHALIQIAFYRASTAVGTYTSSNNQLSTIYRPYQNCEGNIRTMYYDSTLLRDSDTNGVCTVATTGFVFFYGWTDHLNSWSTNIGDNVGLYTGQTITWIAGSL